MDKARRRKSSDRGDGLCKAAGRISSGRGRAGGPGTVAAGPSSIRGYTLIEVIVAFALLALALTLLLGSLTNASRQVHWADGAGRATLYAQSLLDQVGVAEPLVSGTRQGSFEDGRYHWSIDTSPYVDAGSVTQAATADGAQLFRVALHIEWGPSEAQQLDLKTLRLSRPGVATDQPP